MLRRKYPNAKIALAGSVDKSKDSISDEELLKLIDMGDIYIWATFRTYFRF